MSNNTIGFRLPLFLYFTDLLFIVDPSPQSWANFTAHIAAADLPPDTKINTNGAGDSFTAGFLIATMLRRTGERPQAPKTASPQKLPTKESSPSKRSSSKKITPYSLYMREKYVALKSQFKDDKRAIFAKCHEMWEKESPDVKKYYERKVQDDFEEVGSNVSGNSWSVSDFSETNVSSVASNEYADPPLQLLEGSNQSLSLESAIQFAGLVAANHVNVNTRDHKHLDIRKILEQADIFPSGPQEI